MKKILITYARKNILTIHSTNGSKLVLIPGANRVDPAVWQRARADQKVARYIEEGIIVEEEQATADSLAGLKPAKAKELIRATIDLETLEIWKLSEERGDIVKVIDAQIELLKKEPPKDHKE